MDTFINQHPTSRHVLFIFCLVVIAISRCFRWVQMESFSIRNFDCSRHYQDICHGQIPELWLHKTLAIFCNVSQCCNFHHLSPSNTFPKCFADTAKHYFKSMDFIAFWTILFPKQSLIFLQSLLHQSPVPGPTININMFSPAVTLRLALTHCWRPL